jgi:hypothetical protein
VPPKRVDAHGSDGSVFLSALVLLTAAGFLGADRLARTGNTGHRLSLWRQLRPTSVTWLGANIPGFTAG